MHTSKPLLLLIFFLLSLCATAQIGTRRHILSNGDTTLVVNRVSGGLKDPDAQFLLRRPIPLIPADSIFPPLESDFNSLEEAALAVNRLINKVRIEQTLNRQEGNDGLAFRLSQLNRRNMKKEAVVMSRADSLLNAQASIDELVDLYAKFGNKPTYYINDIEVSEATVSLLQQSDILRRELKVANTLSGNPNGEIWFEVSPIAIERFRQHGIALAPPAAKTIEFIIAPSTNTSKKSTSGKDMEEIEIKIKENGVERSVKSLRPAK